MSASSSIVVPVVVPRRIDELWLESSVGLVAEETFCPEAWLIVALPASVGFAWGSSWVGAVPGWVD